MGMLSTGFGVYSYIAKLNTRKSIITHATMKGFNDRVFASDESRWGENNASDAVGGEVGGED